jgi:hypothetical protein
MKSFSSNPRKLQEILKAAYRHREHTDVELGSRWQMDLMRDVRRLGPLNAKNNPLLFLDRFVWRFAMGTSALVLFLSVYVGFTGWNPVNEVATFFLNAPVEFTVAQVFGEYERYE